MGFYARIICDSVNSNHSRGHDFRVTTAILRYPRCIHSEFMTHRMFSRNAGSSRAIPVSRMIQEVSEEPFVPMYWGAAQAGMQARAEVSDTAKAICLERWLELRSKAVETASAMLKAGLHKQIPNRVLEPWAWITVVATGNTVAFENFFSLRCHEDAEPHMQHLAFLLRDAYDASVPKELMFGELHAPFLRSDDDEITSTILRKKLSTARCARVSYLTHEGTRDIEKDFELHDRLASSCHWSPFEHVATAMPDSLSPSLQGNLGPGFRQYRKEFNREVCTQAPRTTIERRES